MEIIILPYVFSRYILVRSFLKMVLSEGWMVTAVVVWEEEDKLNREERADRKSNLISKRQSVAVTLQYVLN